MKRIILSISGGSGCGKSVLAKHLVQRLGAERAARIPTDYYLKPNTYPNLTAFFQHALQYDWTLLEAALGQADGNHLTTPIYDFIHFERVALEGGLPFVLRPVVVLDSMVPYPKADISILLHCPDDERKRRIVERDQRWKTQVIENWEQHQRTLAGLLRHNPFFDLELDGMDSLAENARKILSLPALKD